METESLLLTGLSLLAAAAILSALPVKMAKGVSYLLSAAGSAALGAAGLFQALGAPPLALEGPRITSHLAFRFGLDGLSGFFMLVVSALSLAVSVYSTGYTSGTKGRGALGVFYNLFLMSMYAVLSAANVITFLVSWETMSLVSYFLVVFERDEKSSKAGLVYIFMTHIGTAFLVLMFLLFGAVGAEGGFDAMRASAGELSPGTRDLIFVLALVGFGTKAGMVPLHTWLPRAHPAAPSNVSALMSGVMLKMGIYGIVRVAMDILGGGPEWWGTAILAAGAVSSVLGVLYALMEHDLKRLLAYHSVENIGIILLGVGASMVFKAHWLYGLSALALMAGLYHVMNHAVFKGLLFMGAGSVVKAAGTRDMEALGGLVKAMPYTAFFFLVGSVAICGLPPLNGFVSEWATFQALLSGAGVASSAARVILPLGATALALTGALAAACFVKAFGISFLGTPRKASAKGEVGPSMLSGMALLSALCLFLGVFPGAMVRVLSGPVRALSTEAPSFGGLWSLEAGASALSPFAIAVAMASAAMAAALYIFVAGGKKKTSYGDSWDCGMKALTPRMQYTASAFTNPLRVIFKRIYLPSRHLRVSYAIKPFFVKSIRYRGKITPFFEKYFYEPAVRWVNLAANRARLLQSGSLNLYLGYILATLMLLLIFGT